MPDATPRGRPAIPQPGLERVGTYPPHRPPSRRLHHRIIRAGARVWFGASRSAEAGVHQALGGAPEAIGAKRAEAPWDHQQDILKVFDQITDVILKPAWQFRK